MSGNIRIIKEREPFKITVVLDKKVIFDNIHDIYCKVLDKAEYICNTVFGFPNPFALENMIPETFPLIFVTNKHEQSLRDSNISDIVINEIALTIRIMSNKYVQFIVIPLDAEKEFIRLIKFEKSYMKKILDLKLRFYPSTLMYQIMRKVAYSLELINVAVKAILLSWFKKPVMCRIGKYRVFVEVV